MTQPAMSRSEVGCLTRCLVLSILLAAVIALAISGAAWFWCWMWSSLSQEQEDCVGAGVPWLLIAAILGIVFIVAVAALRFATSDDRREWPW